MPRSATLPVRSFPARKCSRPGRSARVRRGASAGSLSTVAPGGIRTDVGRPRRSAYGPDPGSIAAPESRRAIRAAPIVRARVPERGEPHAYPISHHACASPPPGAKVWLSKPGLVPKTTVFGACRAVL